MSTKGLSHPRMSILPRPTSPEVLFPAGSCKQILCSTRSSSACQWKPSLLPPIFPMHALHDRRHPCIPHVHATPFHYVTNCLLLDQNSSIHNINTRGQHNIHTTRVQHEFAKHSLRYTLPRTIKNTPNIILNKIYTHSLHGFATYIKNFFIQTYNIVPCTIINCYICE